MTQNVKWTITATAVLAAATGASLFLNQPSFAPSAAYAQQAQQAEAVKPESLVGAEKLSDAFRSAARLLRPSVVTITANVEQASVQWQGGRGMSPNDIPPELRRLLPEDFFQANPEGPADDSADSQSDSTESIEPELQKAGVGSGVIVSSDGYLITNNHVVENADALQVQLSDGRVLNAEVVGTDDQTDIAVLKIDAQGLVAAKLGDSTKMEVGDWVIAVGSPFELDQTVTAGIISATNRSMQNGQRGGILPYEDFLQTDAAINPGNSGGPLVNLRGEVVGINTAINSRTGTSAGVGFAIPSNTVSYVFEDLKKDGRVRRGYIGAELAEVDYRRLSELGLPAEVVDGVLIAAVQRGGPADRDGLKKGDVVTRINGRTITSIAAMRSVVAMTRPGGQVKMHLYRSGEPIDLVIQVDEMSEERLAQMTGVLTVPELEIKVSRMTEGLARRLDVSEDSTGTVVVEMSRQGRGAKLGLQAGDIIVELSGVEVRSPGDILTAVKQKKDQWNAVVRRGSREILLPPGNSR